MIARMGSQHPNEISEPKLQQPISDTVDQNQSFAQQAAFSVEEEFDTKPALFNFSRKGTIPVFDSEEVVLEIYRFTKDTFVQSLV